MGKRRLSPYVRAAGYRDGSEHTERQNEDVTVIIHTESEEGVENLDEILAIDDNDVFFLGP